MAKGSGKGGHGVQQVPCNRCGRRGEWVHKTSTRQKIDGQWHIVPSTVTIECGDCGGTGWMTE